ncbi:MAG: hypothetical protein HN644_13025 [Rhodospirillales bacterium]|jgi:hypothetical protein|nr:hypothetical protein [Rhodospirillales bacterium]MBT4038435.1 hypothetical protein [Rhodospirillales bacterium]MBT4625696.1 hypothetical protein [Rhodospirillales bacterium]MBT5352362.1 hypothetical protein [Rhodospirillales bacterium]MBT5519808.1 hypothetical protein [Rhodospirillales bacterium]
MSDYKYGIRYKFSGSIGKLEDWMDDNIKGGYTYDLTDMHTGDTPFGQLEVMFHFEHGADRERFKKQAASNPEW